MGKEGEQRVVEERKVVGCNGGRRRERQSQYLRENRRRQVKHKTEEESKRGREEGDVELETQVELAVSFPFRQLTQLCLAR